jgi:DNA (cytosine-5)-methyltransferase 1
MSRREAERPTRCLDSLPVTVAIDDACARDVREEDRDRPTALDLFAGAGGLSRGLLAGGFDVLAAVDNWAPAVRSYAENFAHRVLDRDLARLSPRRLTAELGLVPGELDLVAGGPPCQGFSIQRIGSDTDARNDLILSFAEFVAKLKPRMFLMENVPGLLGKRGTAVAKAFSARLEKAGYDVRYARVNAAEYGVPQMRRRVLFYGWLKRELQEFRLPDGTLKAGPFRSVWSAIGDLPSPPTDYTSHPDDVLHRRTRLSELNVRRLSLIPPGGGFEHLPRELRVDCHRDGPERIGHRYVYGRLHPDEPAATITARFDSFTRGKFAHPYENRNITLREGARLQTFPDSHVFLGTQEEIAALIGNSVPPLFATRVASAIHAHLVGEMSNADRQRRLWEPVNGERAA